MKNVFSGTDGLRNYLAPAAMGNYPLVELPPELNPFADSGIHIYAKVMTAHPLLSIKALPAWYLVESADSATTDLVEYSSGNTALSMAVYARNSGKKMHAVIAPDVPADKQKLLQLVGCDVSVCDGPQSPQVNPPTGGIAEAARRGSRRGWQCMNQYTHAAVVQASQENIADQLLDQLDSVAMLCAAMGTGGTITGGGGGGGG